jgi:fluoroacetyl-CoA thioesterase
MRTPHPSPLPEGEGVEVSSPADMLTVGLVGEATTTVDASGLASAVGSGGMDVFSTPSLVALMENAARLAVESLLPADQTTVGVRVDIRHLAASPPGEDIRARAELTEVDGRRLVFHVEAFDSHEKVGEGTHERMVVDPARLIARAQAKRSIAKQ